MIRMRTIIVFTIVFFCIAGFFDRPAMAQSEKVLAQLRADLEILNENQRKIYNAVKTMQAKQQENSKRLDALEKKMAASGSLNDEDKEPVQKQIAILKSELKQERKAREALVDTVVKRVTGRVSELVDTIEQPQPDTSNATDSSEPGIRMKYEVQQGDTLGAIAKAFDVKISALRKANDIDGDLIRVGQELKIPEKTE